jgi:hypothetical protein
MHHGRPSSLETSGPPLMDHAGCSWPNDMRPPIIHHPLRFVEASHSRPSGDDSRQLPSSPHEGMSTPSKISPPLRRQLLPPRAFRLTPGTTWSTDTPSLRPYPWCASQRLPVRDPVARAAVLEGIPMRCPSCGFENPEGMKFCNECGTPLQMPCAQRGGGGPVAGGRTKILEDARPVASRQPSRTRGRAR